MKTRALWPVPLMAACACAAPAPPSALAPSVSAAAATPRPAPPGATPVPSATPAPSPTAAQLSSPYRACGALACKAFPSSEAAFDHVLTQAPRVLAIGEAHAQSAGAKAPSSTRRFMDTLLPRLAPRASDLVIELWVANGSCGKLEQKVAKQQQAVTAPQAETNQNEFMELGHRAKALKIQPHALVPSCQEYEQIAGAGAADIEEMLRMLKSVTQRDVEKLLGLREKDRLIVAYGGAMHNDLAPREGRRDFSFGPELSRFTGDQYVELDLVIPEQIKDTEAWRALPWHAHYDRGATGSEAFLYSWAPHAYALIFPKSS